ncbi:MAG: hypothetical protein ABSC17_04240 [Thermacetogeniaceae bacterium]
MKVPAAVEGIRAMPISFPMGIDPENNGAGDATPVLCCMIGVGILGAGYRR